MIARGNFSVDGLMVQIALLSNSYLRTCNYCYCPGFFRPELGSVFYWFGPEPPKLWKRNNRLFSKEQEVDGLWIGQGLSIARTALAQMMRFFWQFVISIDVGWGRESSSPRHSPDVRKGGWREPAVECIPYRADWRRQHAMVQ